MADRRTSAWSDPRTWMSLTSILLTIMIVICGFVAKELGAINTKLETLVVAKAQQGEQVGALQQRMTALETRVQTDETNQNAYNFNLKADLVEVKTNANKKTR